MKRILIGTFFILISIGLNAQGSGIGYYFDVGGSAFMQPSAAYDQYITSYAHNGFIRFHSKSGNRALQLIMAYKTDEVWFQNNADFMEPDGITISNYNTEAQIERTAWKFGMVQQLQFGRRPGKFMISFNPGMFLEVTDEASRWADTDGFEYALESEINPVNLGCTLGGEIRFGWLTLGYKAERLLGDVLNRDYILSQELNVGNSSELRGLVLNPWMNYFYIGINIDFFDDDSD